MLKKRLYLKIIFYICHMFSCSGERQHMKIQTVLNWSNTRHMIGGSDSGDWSTSHDIFTIFYSSSLHIRYEIHLLILGFTYLVLTCNNKIIYTPLRKNSKSKHLHSCSHKSGGCWGSDVR
ncbi:hypothetical protein GDO78_008391 [Eleutherodactylus coqui]|uniref:Uncharacterized protein n=1 Tax=Eleutherodactylus coqui TaxID=57060 RepID=A0A8J6FET1_ELECQ|nr:hypothetical protein GDO78_008391 [Eleutherodactylus coqui]